VNKADTTTTITSDTPDPSNIGQAVTVNFTVVANAPGSGTPTGNVTVIDGNGNTCTGTVAAGTCSLTMNTPGNNTLTATYAGDGNFNGSFGTASHDVNQPFQFSISDSSVVKPATGTTTMIFNVTLAQPAISLVTVHYATAHDAGGSQPATDNVDYDVTSGDLTFNAGEQFKTVPVTVHANAAISVDQTFLVNLSSPSGGTLVRPQAKGTIKVANTPSIALISELRTSGPGGPGDDFVEIWNNTASDITVASTDGSAGWTIVKSGSSCASAPVIVATINNGTVIPARGHYLVVGSQYSLSSYAAGDQTFTLDIENDSNVGLFSTADLGNIGSGTKLDGVGFDSNTGGVCDVLKEGTAAHIASGSTSQYSYARKQFAGSPQDTDDNLTDFLVVSTTPATAVGSNAPVFLGGPGPENKATSPLLSNATFGVGMVDTGVGPSIYPNRERVLRAACGATCDNSKSNLGLLIFRRKFVNNTGGPVTSLRVRIVNLTTVGTAGGNVADLRVLGGTGTVPVTISSAGNGGNGTTTVTVQNATLETPPAQPNGGGINSTMTVPLGTPLANGASVDVQFVTGVQQIGTFYFFLNVEAK
jgi:hypothetical protein